MRLLRPGWLALRWCAQCVGSFVLWTLWLLLAALLVLQVVVGFSRELRVPARVIRSFEDRLALAGLRASFESASFDGTGRIQVDNLRIYSQTLDDPLLAAKEVVLQIDPLALLTGALEPREIQATGLSLLLPAMLSPTGEAAPVVDEVTLQAARDGDDLFIRRLTGRAGVLAVSARGTVSLGRGGGAPGESHRDRVSRLLSQYLRLGREWSLLEAKLASFEEPRVHVEFSSNPRRGAQGSVRFSARKAPLSGDLVPGLPAAWTAQLEEFSAWTELPAAQGSTAAPVELQARAGRITLPEGTELRRASAWLKGSAVAAPFRLEVREAAIAADTVTGRGHTLSAVSAHATLAQPDAQRLRLEASARVADETWGAEFEGNPRLRAGTWRAEGRISRDLIALAGTHARRDLLRYLSPEKPIRISIGGELQPGGRLGRVQGRFQVDRVDARTVLLDRAEAHFTLEGDQLRVSDIVLAQDESLALGTYEMNTRNLDFRFLLQGRLRPIGIGGWFGGWWGRFWDYFDFTSAAPRADVDVQGRWKEPHLVTVFVHVDGEQPRIRGVPFDLVRTTLFIRPDYYDALEISASRPEGSARGRFTRSMAPGGGFRSMDFDVTTGMDLQESARVFGAEGSSLVEPFRFERPPSLKLSGRLEGEASPNGRHESVSIDVASAGGFWFFEFPLSDLHCTAQVQDEVIDVQNLKVGFAGGTATGSARVFGRAPGRKLTFDADIQGAGLGESIRILEDFIARRQGESPPPISRFQQRVASGRLNLKAAATGMYQDVHSYEGRGTADLHGAELAQINLLGALSEALRGNALLGFTSWRLDTAETTFTIEREKLVFPELRITGPSAKLEAHGHYSLASKTMDFNGKFYPFEQGKTLLANAVDLVLTPVSAVLEVKLTGKLDQPKWFFTYGPTSLLRALSGADEEPGATPRTPPKPPLSPLRRR